MSSINRMYYGTKKIYPFLEGEINNDNTNCPECPECPELTSIDIVENGTYEGSFGVVNVNVPSTGGGEGGANAFSTLGWSDADVQNMVGYFDDYALRKKEEWGEGREDATEFFREDPYGHQVVRLVFAPMLDTSKTTSMAIMFYGCKSLVGLPMYDTSNCTWMADIFNNCMSLKYIPPFDTSKVVVFNSSFRNCSIMTEGPKWDTSSAQYANSMFAFCTSLVSMPLYDFSNVIEMNEFFGYYGVDNGINHLTTLGGFEGLKIDWADDNGLGCLPSITYESIMNVINHLYDFRANGDNDTTKTLKIHPNTMALLSDEDKQIAINKGWILTE